MDDPYLNDLRGEFNSYSNQLKKLKKKLLKTNSIEEQEKIIKQIDSTAKKMENNQTLIRSNDVDDFYLQQKDFFHLILLSKKV